MIWRIMDRGGQGHEVVTENDFGVQHSCGVTQGGIAEIENFIFQHAKSNDAVSYPDGTMTRIYGTALA